MTKIEALYKCIQACNGEIRLRAFRHGKGWYCLVTLKEVDLEMSDRWEDLCGSEEDLWLGKNFFYRLEGEKPFIVRTGDTPKEAYKNAIEAAITHLGFEDF